MSLRMNLIALGFVLAAPALAAPFQGKGTNILHLTLRTDFAPNPDLGNPNPDVTGSLDLKVRQQGKADVQKLRLQLSGLTDMTTYSLYVVRDPLAPEMVDYTFETENGEASLKLMHLGHGNGKKTFPMGLAPLTDVLAIQVRNGNVVVAEADLTEPDWLQYLVKRRLTPTVVDADAAGSLFMKEHGAKVLFRLRAGNLDDENYTLAITGVDDTDALVTVETPVTADADGRLDIKGLPDGAPTPFRMTQVELINAGDQVVLGAELPAP
jgi:hypothetical protein